MAPFAWQSNNTFLLHPKLLSQDLNLSVGIQRLDLSSCVCMPSCFSRVQLFATPRTVAHQAPLSMGFSRQEYWSRIGCHVLLQGIFLTQELKPTFLMSPSLAGGFFTTSATWQARGWLHLLSILKTPELRREHSQIVTKDIFPASPLEGPAL